ncbi:unnamed protein product [Calypogeia fissa]
MLRRMAVLVVSPAAFCARDWRRGLLSVPKVLDGVRRIPAHEKELVFVGVHMKWRPFICQRNWPLHLRGKSTWTNKSGLIIRSRSGRHDFNKQNNVTGPSSYSISTGGMYSEGRMDSAPVQFVSIAEPSRMKISPEKLLAATNSEVLIKSIIYEAQKGCINVVGKTMRFDDFLLEQVTAQAENDNVGLSLESRNLFQSLSAATKQYDQMGKKQRLALLNKVAESLGFNSLLDLIAHGNAAAEASEGLHMTEKKNVQSSDISLLNGSFQSSGVSEKLPPAELSKETKPNVILRQVRGIKYGSSDPIKLPDRIVKSASAVASVVDPQISKGSTSATRTRRKVAMEFADSSKDVQQKETIADLEVSEISQSEKLTSVPLKESRIRAVQPARKTGSRSVRSVVTVTNASKTKQDYSSPKGLTEPDRSSSSPAFVIDENWGLDTPISAVKSLSGPNRARLEENGFYTMRLLLQHFPRMYQNFKQAGQRVEDGQNLSFMGTVVESRGMPRGFSLGMIEVIVKSEVDEIDLDDGTSALNGGQHEDFGRERMGRTVFLHLKRFFKGFRYSSPGFLNSMASKYPVNAQVTVCGKVKQMPQPDHFEIPQFNIELWDGATSEESGPVSDPELLPGGKPYPVYPGKGSLQPKTIEFCIQRLLPLLSAELDPIPMQVRDQFQIQELHEAYKGIHSPNQTKDAEVARRRLVFDEFFYLQLGMLLQRQELAEKCSPALGTFDMTAVLQGGVLDMNQWSPLTLKLLKTLPYSLTNSQMKAAGEVIWDLRRPIPMSRLLQGDVGCGKTIVAFLALLEIVGAGYQGALMAPTEFLAIQHYERITSWLENLEEAERPTVALLTGSTPLSKARATRRGFESGEIALAVGTHTLISDSVKFSALRLAVIDEQHRFGVAQRGRLNSKVRDSVQIPDGESNEDSDVRKAIQSAAPHILAMSATPIPRTLALAMHGDMSLSQITELPPGRAETATHAIYGDKKGRQAVYKRVRKELESGGRIFVVFPVIDESRDIPDVRAAETEFKNLEEDFKEFKFGLVHGRMRAQEKDEAMQRFKSGETQVLVSTTVIEVGIDIPEASMIVVEHAERYGMAQLHQLRGRVGRGTRASSCILLGSRPSSLARLKLLETTRDGFYLAEIDMQQRGPGDMLGKRQSGYLPEFNIARLDKDGDILEQARSAAEELLQRHPKLDGLPKIRHELSMRRPAAPLS